jgi:hypothetical protein
MKRIVLAAALAAAACTGGGGGDAPWLTAKTPASHAAFPIDSGAHAGLDCNECHGAFDTFREFACLDCHAHERTQTDANHAGVEGYAYDSPACYRCHPDGTGEGAGPEHEAIFPIAEGTAHAAVACGSCHVVPGDRSQVDCVTCHPAAAMSPQHGAVGGYQHATGECLRCHADAQVDRVSSHLPFRIGGGASHDREACGRCHAGVRTDKPFPAIDFARFDCLACHPRASTQNEHDEVGGFRYESSACYGCHRSGEGGDD